MKKKFFCGAYFSEIGPAEVNKNIVSCLPKSVMSLKCRNRFLSRIEILFKILFCNVFVLSALGEKDYEIWFAKFLKKKIVYLMHGFAVDESAYLEAREAYLLPRTDLIIGVSETFSQEIKRRYPQYNVTYLTNGINWAKLDSINQGKHIPVDRNEIILIGGGRWIKSNLNVCKAIQRINDEKQTNLHVSVYGVYNPKDESPQIKEIQCVSFVGFIPHEDLLKKMSQAYLFIQNSTLESFSLSVVESLVCGCNLLISKNVGARDVIPGLHDTDIVENCQDIEEIENKILQVLETPNNARLIDSVDRKTTSIQFAAEKLVRIVSDL